MEHDPPRGALKFLRWFCSEQLLEEIEGDLYESYIKDIAKGGVRRANINYIINVLLFIRPFAIRKNKITYETNSFAMFKNYIVIAFRSLKKKVGYSLVNIAGLSVGLACSIIILMYVKYELSYEDFQIGTENTYRMALNRVYPGRSVDFAVIPHSIGHQMQEDFPEVQQIARVIPPFGTQVFRYGDKFFDEDKVIVADSTIFDVFTIPLVSGNPKTALVEQNSAVISESTAKKYFGTEDPLGKTLEANNNNFLITAVAKDYPKNSHLEFEIITSTTGIPFLEPINFTSFVAQTYIKLTDGFDPKILEAKLPAFLKKYADGQIRATTGMSYDEYIAAGNGYNYTLQPFKDIHLHSDLQGEFKQNGNYTYVIIFISVAAFILLIACINFMNLSTARSTERAKEVGLRKVMGSIKEQLVFQFLTESVLLAFMSLVVALGLAYLSFPYFSGITGINFSFALLGTPWLILAILVGTIVIGLLAGLYPAFVISGFMPAVVLKGRMQTSAKGVYLRNGLVVFQFAISIMLISCTLIIYDQMSYLLNKDMGFDKENMLIIENANVITEKTEVFRDRLLSNPNVLKVGYSSGLPGRIYPGFVIQPPDGEKETYVARQLVVDENMLETMGLSIIAGRGFQREFNDSLSVILNQSAVNKLGISNPIGKKITHSNNDPTQNRTYTIIGIIEDYHFHTLHREIEPQAITHTSGAISFIQYIGVKITPNNVSRTIQDIEQEWRALESDSPFKSTFLDDDLKQHYNAERQSGSVFTTFTSVAIIIACIGLFSLAAYMAGQKRKEIGVRKVMGASVLSIVFLLSRDFTKLILVSIVLAVPVSYLWMSNWLEEFAYRIDLGVGSFILAGGASLLIGWITVSFQSIKAAIVNPTESLRNE